MECCGRIFPILGGGVKQNGSVIAVLIAGALAISAYILWTGRHRPRGKAIMKPRKMTPEELQNVEWEHVGRVSRVWLYPIKSCAAISLPSAQAWPLGLTDGKLRDRSFVFSTEKGNMIKGNMIGGTVRIKPVISGNTLILKHDDMDDLPIDLDQVEAENKEATVNIYGDIAPGLDCGDVAAQWLEKAFGKKARLLYHSSIPSPRKTEELVGEFPLMKGDDNGLYSDKFAFMLLTKESVADLQSRVDCPTSAENFRPNLLIEGSKEAYDEDDWAYIKIGDAVFRNVSPCERCPFITVDHNTGLKEKNSEPLRTLKTYRMVGDQTRPNFGINLGLELLGTVRVEDDVYVTRVSQM